MDFSTARADLDVIEASLQFVRDGVAYIGIISHKYGQTPPCATRNPNELSITELEFDEACRLDRPILLFIMGDTHPVLAGDVEKDPENIKKLEAFRERAKRWRADGGVNRVYSAFNRPEEFKTQVANALANLKPFLERFQTQTGVPQDAKTAKRGALPRPSVFRAVPRYAGSHPFVGRANELKALSDWATASDPNPMFLLEAIGGSGKSMLAWQWINRHAPAVRGDWTGRFWYSFYEKGAVMAQFCREAVAYLTGESMEALRRKRTRDLADQLIEELTKRPWLIVMDGLERVLVAYHRYNASQLRDDEISSATDQIGRRDPCAAIRSEDDDVLRRLTIVSPSKVIVTSRLVPRALLNLSRRPVPGVRHVPLKGLQQEDAEAMFRACGVTGIAQNMQIYLEQNCGYHPLVIGVLAGLVNDYLPDRGNFDGWVVDPNYGGRLNLGTLDLTQRQNHILEAAFDALPIASRQLLSTLALLAHAADYEMLTAFNPYLNPKPIDIKKPGMPTFIWPFTSKRKRQAIMARYELQHARWAAYTAELKAWEDSARTGAQIALQETVQDLERRGLLQYDASEKLYDLHPVVRGVTSGRMGSAERQKLGQQMVDHFSSRADQPYERAETLQDVENGIEVVRGLLQLGRFAEAVKVYTGGLGTALYVNLEEYTEILALLRPLFPNGWQNKAPELDEYDRAYILTEVAIALSGLNLLDESLAIDNIVLESNLKRLSWHNIRTSINSIATDCDDLNRLASSYRLCLMALDLAELLKGDSLVIALYRLFTIQITCGLKEEVEVTFFKLPRGWIGKSNVYRAGSIEYWYEKYCFQNSKLEEFALSEAERLAKLGHSHAITRQLKTLRGQWHLNRGENSAAIEALEEAVRLSRTAGFDNVESEALLAFARACEVPSLGAWHDAERLSSASPRCALAVGKLWQVLGAQGRATKQALKACRWAIADGEPYIRRFELEQARSFLTELGVKLPPIPKHNPVETVPFVWEKNVSAAIGERRAAMRRAEEEKRLLAEKEREKAKGNR